MSKTIKSNKKQCIDYVHCSNYHYQGQKGVQVFELLFIYFLGEEHTFYQRNQVVKPVQPIVEGRSNCGTKFSNLERTDILNTFNALPNHEAQNIALQGCVSVVNPPQVRRRPRQEEAKQRQSFTYSITLATRTVSVCKAAF